MSQSQILSKISRLGLLSIFCAGLFFTSGELTVNPNDGAYLTSGGVYSAMAAETKKEIDPMDATVNGVITIINLAISILTFMVTPLIMLAGWLLSPDWTFGEIFGLRPILHQLWILISNVVYVIFGFMLVFVAFANIFGGESSKAYEMKTMLPKLVTGMLMVPFTWFIVSATLSVSNVLTASVISLPMETILKAGGDTNTLLTDKIIPKKITFDKDATSKADVTTGGNGETTNGSFTASKCPDNCISIKEFLTGGGGGAYNLLSVYAYGIFRIQGYKAITTEQKINKVIDVANKLGFGVIFFLVFGVLVVAIVYALFSRAIMLWLYAMFSPFFALTYVLGDKAKKLEKFSIKEFISLAMVPVYVSAALAFGLMFLGLVMGATGTEGKTGDGVLKTQNVEIKTEKKGKDSTTTFDFGTGPSKVTFITKGLLNEETKDAGTKALDMGKGIIGTIIMNVLALAILWMAVMAALGSSKITEAAVKPIADFGSEIGKLAMKAPQYIPIPLPGKNADGTNKSVSMAGLQGISNTISGALSTAASNQGAEIGKTFAEALGIKQSELTEALRNATNSLGQHKGNKDLQVQDWSKAIGGMKSVENMKAHKDTIVPQLGSMLDKTDTISTADRDKLKGLAQKGEFADFIKEFNKIAKDSSGNTIASQSATPDDIIKAAAAKGGTTTSTTTPATAIPATPPTVGTTNMPTINKTHITVNGTAPIATGGTSSARTITVAQFDAIKTASGMSDADLKTKLASEHISVIQ